MRFFKYVGYLFLFIIIITWLWIFLITFFTPMVVYIKKGDYESLSFLIMVLGMIFIIIGYWFKLWVSGRANASPYIIEYYQNIREKYMLKEKISFTHKVDLWIIDGYSIKIGNRIGITLLSIGAIIYIVKYIL
ncbi:hypothetical protein [Aliarcobacter lanthieri]|uniref:hypothetical protein n=1 Tax=Aliarcobacter lanthieri TaxID=1355374 RepID=UPI003AAA5C4B